MNNNIHFSSKTDQWATPRWFAELYKKKYRLTLDVCADEHNSVCDDFYSKKDNGLSQEWRDGFWMNPPYGRGIIEWVKKADNSGFFGVGLLPARTDTRWFQDHCIHHPHFFVKGRLKFGDSKNSAPFPSVVVLFNAFNNSK